MASEDDSGLLAGAGTMPPPPRLSAPAELEFPRASALLHETRVVSLSLRDIRFPTSATLTGSDARSKDPDYSVVYAEVTFERAAGAAGPPWRGVGVGIAFSLGRGNELLLSAARLLARGLRGLSLGEVAENFGAAWRRITGVDDGQLVWMGPERGVVHQASACLVNAVWDGWAKHEGLPVWKLVASLPPAQLAAAIDTVGVADALGSARDVAAWLEAKADGRAARVAELEASGVRCYTTAMAWAGYSDAKVEELMRRAIADGFTQFKMKVGLGRESDLRRAGLLRRLLDEAEAVRAAGGGAAAADEPFELFMDANSVWSPQEAVDEMSALAVTRPAWIEEPISPDDILGHEKIATALKPLGIGVASGEQCANKVMMKQFLELGLAVCQADAVKYGGLNEWLACSLLAARKGAAMCPHAGGVGLCQMAAHLSCIDYACVSGSRVATTTEHIDHLQENFATPLTLLRGGRYAAPSAAGWGLELKPEALREFEWPHGTYWSASEERRGHFDAAGTPW